MSDDFLKQFSQALAEEHDGATAVPEAGRARVIRALAEKRRRSRKWWVVGVPALALLGGSTAWAAASGKLPALIEQAVAVFIEPPTLDSPTTRSDARRSGAAHQAPPQNEVEANEVEALEPESEPAPPLETNRETPPEPLQEKLVASGEAAADSGRDRVQTASETLPTALATYRAAHRSQFQDGDCALAVDGYQKYLNEEPSGSFALEAKYNRGVCLAKLGRTDEAVRALRPFAEGKFGDYRQEKSRALVEALEKSAGPGL